jgi:uncharacterized protein (TIGR00369 family)
MTTGIREPKTHRHLDQLRDFVAGVIPPPPISQLIGMRMVGISLGESIMELDATSRHANPMGTLHGGILCDLGDGAMGTALATTLEDDESFTSVDLTAKFFKPIWNARLRATARVTRRTRSLGFVECDIVDDGGSVVAKMFSTCMVLRGNAAEGR